MPHLLIVTQISVVSKRNVLTPLVSPFTARSASARLRRTEREGSAITSPSKCLLLFTSTLDSIGSGRLNFAGSRQSLRKVLRFNVPAQCYGNWRPLAGDCGNAEGRAGNSKPQLRCPADCVLYVSRMLYFSRFV